MTVFKTFLRVLNKAKAPIILYTVILILFAGFNMETDNPTNFTAEKPSIYIVNQDQKHPLSKSLTNYMKKNCKLVELKDVSIEDALFYRDISYVIYIPKNFGKDLLEQKNPQITVKSTKDYNASLSEMILNRYIQTAKIYSKNVKTEEELVEYINSTLEQKIEVDVMSKLDTINLNRATFYYNFLNYSLLAGLIYVICLILSSFKEEKIKKRTIISSMNYKKFNRKLLFSNSLFAILLWLFYVILSIIIVGEVMLTSHGLFYILNSFVFSICALSLAFLIGNTIINKNAINGIVNVIALGSCFLCGAFVPMEMLPKSVLTIAHILPSYWYIKTNELLKGIEVFTLDSLFPILINMLIVILFTIGFVIITNMVTKRYRK